MKRIRNVIFDLDGTLIDSSDGVVAAFHHAFRRAGLPLPPPEQIKPFIGYPLEVAFAHFTDCPPALLRQYFREAGSDTIVAATEPLPGAREALEEIRSRGFRTAIATTKILANIDGILDKLGWRHLFDTYAGGNEVSRVKPDPEQFRLVLQRLDAAPEHAIVIGDTINDVLAAKAIPMPVIVVASPFEPREKVISTHPDFSVESITGVPGILDEINARVEEKL